MEQLILKYLQGDLTLDEQHELSKWLQSDERNAKTLQQIHAYWHYHKDNIEKEEQEVRSRLHGMMQAEMASGMQASKKTIWKTVYKIAASIAIVCSLVFMFYQYKSGSVFGSEQVTTRLVEKVSLPGQKITTLLPDGTKVKLNADSKLIVPSQFDGKAREVTLIGEAFFEVARDEKHPFIIKTTDIDIQVLGTSFNVNAYSGEMTSVAVKTGRVAVKTKNNEQVKLTSDQMVRLEGTNLKEKPIVENDMPFAWTNQSLAFNDESVDQVLKRVSRWYGVQIDLKKNITKDKKYTANYDNPTIKEMMEVLSYVYDFNYELNEKEKMLVIK